MVRPRFSIRTMLALVTLAGVYFGCWEVTKRWGMQDAPELPHWTYVDFGARGRYPIHWEFARAHLSGNGKPFVDELAQFNTTEYTSPERRFVLGAVTHYENLRARGELSEAG